MQYREPYCVPTTTRKAYYVRYQQLPQRQRLTGREVHFNPWRRFICDKLCAVPNVFGIVS